MPQLLVRLHDEIFHIKTKFTISRRINVVRVKHYVNKISERRS
jgi:hypothetical protein